MMMMMKMKIKKMKIKKKKMKKRKKMKRKKMMKRKKINMLTSIKNSEKISNLVLLKIQEIDLN
jgi:hypothetical protein